MSSINCEDRFFEIGKIFKNIDELKECIKRYNKKYFTSSVITTSNKNSVYIKCKHGREKENQNARGEDRNNITNITAYMWFYKSQKEGATTMNVTKVDFDHNRK